MVSAKPPPDEIHVRTFRELQKLEGGKLQALGDRLLPCAYDVLAGLKPYGLNQEGKARKGVPDSYVGTTPQVCHAAVEYTTRQDLETKLKEDFEGVRTRCPTARVVFLCTSRSTRELSLAALEEDAARANIALTIVDGWDLAALLCGDYQELRLEFLDIPMGAHTRRTLVSAMRERLRTLARPVLDVETFLRRTRTDRAVEERVRYFSPSQSLVIGPAGGGKSTWSLESALRYSSVTPVIWLPAKALSWPQQDPIATQVLQHAYGTPDVSRVPELAELLRKENFFLRIYLDAIDEVPDYRLLIKALQNFVISRLGPLSHVILTCRDGAMPFYRPLIGSHFPELIRRPSSEEKPGGLLEMQDLSEEQAFELLRKSEADLAQARAVIHWLPTKYQGNPFFLKRALAVMRASGLPKSSDDIVGTIIDFFIRDISVRLEERGQQPSSVQIQRSLEALAVHALKAERGSIHADELVDLPVQDAAREGPRTLIGAALQSGILLQTAQEFVFAHPLFLEHLAAKSLARNSSSWNTFLPSMATPSGRTVATRLVAALDDPTPLLEELAKHDLTAACQAASNVKHRIGAELIERLLESPRSYLASRFPSEQTRGLQLLAGLRGPAAIQLAVDWFNGQAEKNRLVRDAAILFLELEVPQATQVIINHPQITFAAIEPRYELSFVRHLEQSSASFRDALRHQARRRLLREENENGQRYYLTLLAMLRDEWIVEYLRVRLGQGRLGATEHRALIFLNTSTAVDLYVESVDQYLEQLQHNEFDGAERWQMWREIVLHNDVTMFPHDLLLEVVETALESPVGVHVSFGFHWAELLSAERMVAAYCSARRRHPRNWMSSDGFVRSLLKSLPFSQILVLYERHPELRRGIVHQLDDVAGQAAEDFLIQCLADPQYRFSAIQTLGRLGMVQAGLHIQDYLQDQSGHVRAMAAMTLGRLQYAPALGRMCSLLREAVLPQPGGGRRGTPDDEFTLIKGISLIGGPEANRTLMDVFPTTCHADDVLRGLLLSREKDAIAFVRQKVDENPQRARPWLLEALTWRDLVDSPEQYDVLPPCWLKDRTLLQHVIQATQPPIDSGGLISPRANPIEALAAFDLEEAHSYLEQVATRCPMEGQGHELHATHMANPEPVREARRILGLRGNSQYAEEFVGAKLDCLEQQTFMMPFHVERLREWPRGLIRTALHRRLNEKENWRWVSLLRSFSEPGDRTLFERLEQSSDIEVADQAHQWLSSQPPR